LIAIGRLAGVFANMRKKILITVTSVGVLGLGLYLLKVSRQLNPLDRCDGEDFSKEGLAEIFGSDPFIENLTSFIIFHESEDLDIKLSRALGEKDFRLTLGRGSEQRITSVAVSKLTKIARLLRVKRTGFLGLKFHDGKFKVPKDLIERAGFGCCEPAMGPGFILSKERGMEEQTVTLGNKVESKSEQFYIMSTCGSIYTVDLSNLFSALNSLAEEKTK
jgi:hypothetical protein